MFHVPGVSGCWLLSLSAHRWLQETLLCHFTDASDALEIPACGGCWLWILMFSRRLLRFSGFIRWKFVLEYEKQRSMFRFFSTSCFPVCSPCLSLGPRFVLPVFPMSASWVFLMFSCLSYFLSYFSRGCPTCFLVASVMDSVQIQAELF